jgi:hypothetical protein
VSFTFLTLGILGRRSAAAAAAATAATGAGAGPAGPGLGADARAGARAGGWELGGLSATCLACRTQQYMSYIAVLFRILCRFDFHFALGAARPMSKE